MYFSTEIMLATIILMVLLAGIYFSTMKLVLAGIIFLMFVSCYQETNSWSTTHKLFTLMASLTVLLMSKESDSDYNLLLLLVMLGALMLMSATNLLMVYVGMELQSLALLMLIAKKKTSMYNTEAGLKYFVLGALTSGLLLLGIALIYSLGYITINQVAFLNNQELTPANIGKVLITMTLLFKMAAVPFHFWAPDIYDGASPLITATMMMVPKFSYFSMLAQILPSSNLMMIAALLSLCVGAIGALNQTKLKRLLAYSGMMNTGFILLGISSNSMEGMQASLSYLMIYTITSMLMFTALLTLKQENPLIYSISGLSSKTPTWALIWGLAFFSMAGMPPLMGFYAKWLVLLSVINKHFMLMATTAMMTSVMAAVYYVRMVLISYFQTNQSTLTWNTVISPTKLNHPQTILLGTSSYLLMSMILIPDSLYYLVQWATLTLV